MASLFWGLKMEPGKRYSTTVDKSFHISMATLDPLSVSADNEVVSVLLEERGGGVFYLTNLRKMDLLFSNLDLNFIVGDKITLFCKGSGIVHLSGYMVPDEDDISTTMLDDEAEEEEDEEVDEEEMSESFMNSLKGMSGKKGNKNEAGLKRKQENENNKKAKKKKMQEIEEDSDESDVDDDDLTDLLGGKMAEADSGESEEGEDEEDEDEDDDDDEDVEEEEEEKIIFKKQKNQQKNQSPNVQQQQHQQQQKGKKADKQNNSINKTPNGVASPQQKTGKKEDTRKSMEAGKPQQNQNKQQGGETTLTGGVKVKDVRKGEGQLCKPGKQAVVYYTGRFKSNGKVFDSVQQGSGFKFKVGRGEVVKGWDIGVVGMKVGGKRIITCPPQVAYGQKGSPPQIPPNSTLVFEVELKNVN